LDAVAVFTAILVIVAWLQWLTLEKTDQTLKLQQRAWIAPGRLIAPQNFIEQKKKLPRLASISRTWEKSQLSK
jgi:hypothetical protein